MRILAGSHFSDEGSPAITRGSPDSLELVYHRWAEVWSKEFLGGPIARDYWVFFELEARGCLPLTFRRADCHGGFLNQIGQQNL